MCRLIGLVGQIDLWQDVLFKFQEFAESGIIPPIPNLPPGHKDGWGMACSTTNPSEMNLIGKYQGSALESLYYKKNIITNPFEYKQFWENFTKWKINKSSLTSWPHFLFNICGISYPQDLKKHLPFKARMEELFKDWW